MWRDRHHQGGVATTEGQGGRKNVTEAERQQV